MKTIALAVVVAVLSGCAGGSESWPQLDTLYRVEGAEVICDQPAYRSDESERVTCAWERVDDDAGHHCYALVVFSRDDEAAPWEAHSFVSAATCD